MTRLRQAKIDKIAESLPPLEVDDPSGAAKVLVLGWGSVIVTILGVLLVVMFFGGIAALLAWFGLSGQLT